MYTCSQATKHDLWSCHKTGRFLTIEIDVLVKWLDKICMQCIQYIFPTMQIKVFFAVVTVVYKQIYRYDLQKINRNVEFLEVYYS